MRKLVAVVALVWACSVVACGGGGNISSPTMSSSTPIEFSSGGDSIGLERVIGPWTGTETATVGRSGALSVVFSHGPNPGNDSVAAVITWTGGITVHGTVTGPVSNMHIVATDGPAGTCSYNAIGALNQGHNQITGTYTGAGEGPNCSRKAGTFVLNGVVREDEPPPVVNRAPVVNAGPDQHNPPMTAYYAFSGANPQVLQQICAAVNGTWYASIDVPGSAPGNDQKVCLIHAFPASDPPSIPGSFEATLIAPPGIIGIVLTGTATDDGLPVPPGALTYTWSKVSGPGTVQFGPNTLNSSAGFSAEGTYVLRLTVSDGALTTTDDITITLG
jgi:K319-like protein